MATQINYTAKHTVCFSTYTPKCFHGTYFLQQLLSVLLKTVYITRPLFNPNTFVYRSAICCEQIGSHYTEKSTMKKKRKSTKNAIQFE